MAQELENKNTLRETADDRQLVYVRYEDGDDEELDIFDIITLCKKGLLILKKYIALLLVFLVIGGVLGYVKAKLTQKLTYTSNAVLFVDLNRDMLQNDSDTNEAGKISMLANSFAEIVRSDAVITPIAKKYASEDKKIRSIDEDALIQKVDAIRNSISVWTPDGTQIIQVSVSVEVANDEVEHAQDICESVVQAGIASLDSITDYATIKVISSATESRKGQTTRALSSALSMAAIFLALALVIVIVRELGLAYKAHEAATKDNKKENH